MSRIVDQSLARGGIDHLPSKARECVEDVCTVRAGMFKLWSASSRWLFCGERRLRLKVFLSFEPHEDRVLSQSLKRTRVHSTPVTAQLDTSYAGAREALSIVRFVFVVVVVVWRVRL